MKLSKTEQAYRLLRTKIITRELSPGKPLLEEELANSLNMSRTPVHEALIRLEKDGLIDLIQRKGAFIKVFTKDEVIKKYEVAEALEGMIIYLATPNITKKSIKELSKQIDIMDKALAKKDMTTWATHDEIFHDIINTHCNNEFLVKTRKTLQGQIIQARLWLLANWWTDKDKSNQDHKMILKCIEEKNSSKARDIMQKHWERIRSELNNTIL